MRGPIHLRTGFRVWSIAVDTGTLTVHQQYLRELEDAVNRQVFPEYMAAMRALNDAIIYGVGYYSTEPDPNAS